MRVRWCRAASGRSIAKSQAAAVREEVKSAKSGVSVGRLKQNEPLEYILAGAGSARKQEPSGTSCVRSEVAHEPPIMAITSRRYKMKKDTHPSKLDSMTE